MVAIGVAGRTGAPTFVSLSRVQVLKMGDWLGYREGTLEKGR